LVPLFSPCDSRSQDDVEACHLLVYPPLGSSRPSLTAGPRCKSFAFLLSPLLLEPILGSLSPLALPIDRTFWLRSDPSQVNRGVACFDVLPPPLMPESRFLGNVETLSFPFSFPFFQFFSSLRRVLLDEPPLRVRAYVSLLCFPSEEIRMRFLPEWLLASEIPLNAPTQGNRSVKPLQVHSFGL